MKNNFGTRVTVERPQPEPPPAGSAFPRMLYHSDGNMKLVSDAGEYDDAKMDGWMDKPLQVHLDALQMPGKTDAERDAETQAEIGMIQGGLRNFLNA